MVHVWLPISLRKSGVVVCHRSAWQECWNGEEGACADLLPASSVADYGAGSWMQRGGTAMGDRCRGQHGEGVARPRARW
jgi:hypothetical protein